MLALAPLPPLLLSSEIQNYRFAPGGGLGSWNSPGLAPYADKRAGSLSEVEVARSVHAGASERVDFTACDFVVGHFSVYLESWYAWYAWYAYVKLYV